MTGTQVETAKVRPGWAVKVGRRIYTVESNFRGDLRLMSGHLPLGVRYNPDDTILVVGR